MGMLWRIGRSFDFDAIVSIEGKRFDIKLARGIVDDVFVRE